MPFLPRAVARRVKYLITVVVDALEEIGGKLSVHGEILF
jgi:hypothetical protein